METNIEQWVKGLISQHVQEEVTKMVDAQKDALLRDIIGEEVRKVLDEKKDLMKIDEAAEFLGLSKSYLYKKTMTGEIPFYRPLGKVMYFEKSALAEWIRSHPSRTNQDLSAAATQYETKNPLNI